MDAGTKKIQEIFQNNIILKIPYFQRSYVWQEENWERFLNDMLDLPETDDNYFLGSVILKKAGKNDLGYETYDVVDGQQRLTTLVIFSKILYLMASKDEKFKNNFMQDDVDAPVLRPNRKDAAVFNEIVRLEGLGHPVAGKGQVKKAFDYFMDKMNNAAVRDKANTLIRYMNNNVYLVRIIVDENENEQQIFDTINSLGQDLTTGELLKNYLFNDENVALYDEKWVPIFERGGSDYNYWTDQLTKGRLKANNIETFFYYFMLIKMQDPEIRTTLTTIEKKIYRKQEGLFESYKSLIKKHSLNKDSLINEIVEYGKIYHENFDQSILKDALVKYPGINRLCFLLFAQGSWTPVPYLLYILKNVTNDEEKVNIFAYLETYLVRRIICRSKNNNYSDLFSENLIGQGINTYEKFKCYVNDAQSRGTLLMPSDDDVKRAIKENDLTKSAAIILYLLESKMNNSFTSEGLYNNAFISFSLEPLMPIKYDKEKWLLNGNYTEEERDVLVRTLGNHILVRGGKLPTTKTGLNWTTKKSILSQMCQELRLGQVCSSNSWDEDRIITRNNVLGNQIVELWKK